MNNWNMVETQWAAMATQVKARWTKLSAAEIAVIGGKRSLLVAKLQENYNIFQLEAENQVNAWTTKLARAAEAAAAPPVVEGAEGTAAAASPAATAGSDAKTAPVASVATEATGAPAAPAAPAAVDATVTAPVVAAPALAPPANLKSN
jgi:uncharacterized protein YjbJ (UPF0337 family)